MKDLLKNDYANIVEKSKCCGCSACINACPTNALSMREDEEGFLYPVINKELCINCGKCTKVCPLQAPQYNVKPEKCYAIMANDEIRKDSSSGGFFTILSNYVLGEGGVVCGAAFDKDWNVGHIIVDNSGDLQKLRGSKYVQSSMNDTYKQIKNILGENKKVLFTGTPCQVAGLKRFLNKDYENLITLDVVCHGVPNSKTWQKFLNDNFDKNEIEKISFRDKAHGWSCTTTTTMRSKDVICQQDYFRGFNGNVYLRPSCSVCAFTKMERPGDFTVADFWGIDKVDKSLNDNKGTSLLFLNSAKAADIFSQINSQFKTIKEFPISVLDNTPNYPLYRSSVPHKNRDYFFENFEKDFNENIKYTFGEKFDVALLGLWYAGNYGGFLTYWALYKFLQLHNFSPVLIDNCKMINNKFIQSGHKMMLNFVKKYQLQCTHKIKHDFELYDLNKIVDSFIVGSDQVWNYELTLKNFSNYFLDFVQSTKNKISYATSFGFYPSKTPDDLKPETAYYLSKFTGVSVREKSGLDVLKKEFSYDNGKLVLDPVFLYPECYEELVQNSNIDTKTPYMFSYCLDPNSDKEDILDSVSKTLGKEVKVVTDINPLIKDKSKKHLKKFSAIDATIEDWVAYIKNSDFVVTDSFHGTCFAILFKKPFICIANKGRGLTRFETLLSNYNLKHKMIFTSEDLQNNPELFTPINYEEIHNKLSQEREQSINWLLQRLNNKCPRVLSDCDIIMQNNYKKLSIKYYQKSNKFRYYRYYLLSKLLIGKARKRYKAKRLHLKATMDR